MAWHGMLQQISMPVSAPGEGPSPAHSSMPTSMPTIPNPSWPVWRRQPPSIPEDHHHSSGINNQPVATARYASCASVGKAGDIRLRRPHGDGPDLPHWRQPGAPPLHGSNTDHGQATPRAVRLPARLSAIICTSTTTKPPNQHQHRHAQLSLPHAHVDCPLRAAEIAPPDQQSARRRSAQTAPKHAKQH